MESTFKNMFSLRKGEDPLLAVERIRTHPQFPYLSEFEIVNLIVFLNNTSLKYSTTDIKYELYLLFISYNLLPSAYAACRIGEIYLYGRKNKKTSRIRNVRQNYNKALHYLTLASRFNYPKANYLIGMLYYDKNEYENMLHYLELSASVCYPEAIYQLGIIYFQGKTTIKQNFQMAYKYFKHCAQHGNNLGIFMLNNFGDSIKSQYVSQRIEEMISNGMSPITQRDCPVCLEQKVGGYTLSCHETHFVCCQCLDRLLEAEILASGKIKCPMCRAIS